MKKVYVALMVIVLVFTFSACGSDSSAYPVFLGSSYQDVYDYCKENNVESDNIDAIGFFPNDYSISADLDWLGGGEVCTCRFDVSKEAGEDVGVERIAVSYPYDDSELLNDDLEKVVEKVINELKEIHGDPIGDSEPNVEDLVMFEDEDVIWEGDDYSVRLSAGEGGFSISYQYKEE